ncbi:O-acetylhomoserine aminocarboxypropyltransferase [Cohaesibacter haloalkalitolerans]|uniref:O-acetylhomoserine aminocarboxypropyltransferase n=1 Tax=Cohaesibacter haloalkalitolerans TaxID=1162980 RepID=UPI000E65D972|nr:O-acetylhomoserine aminocarboxypropyltransferase [Cohaesibacter haloalkalitolerans]
MSEDSAPGFSTLAIHAGAQADPTTGARSTPIYQTTSYLFRDTEHAANLFGLREFGNIYTRLTNPTTAVLDERIAALEGGSAGVSVASGHAAQLITFHSLMGPGDNMIAANKLYGGTINQLNHTFKSFDWHVKWTDALDPEAARALVDEKTKGIYIESLANPGGVICDIEGFAKVAKDAGVPLIVDNTMATPYLCRPIEHGANIVVHSMTKFIGGHGNSMGGIIVDGGNFDWSQSDRFPMVNTPRAEYNGVNFYETFGPMAFAITCRALGLRDLGPAISPFNAFQILTGVETLPLRMERHCANALVVATWLENNDKVGWVSYAGLESSPHKAAQEKYMPKGAGSVFTFGLKGGHEAGVKFITSLKLISHVANIGDTRSLAIHPASTTHSQLTDEQKTAAGAAPDTIRLSIGIEDVKDIIADLEQAMA